MRKLPFVFLLVLTFCASLAAQTDERFTCPNVDITGPAEKTRVGELITFTANVDTFGKEYDLKYNWHVNEGFDSSKSLEIISGQGTPTITVRQAKGSVTATLEVGGPPQDCERTSSETAFVDPSAVRQDCPGIELTGPQKMLRRGQDLEYNVHVETGGEEIKLEYVWAAVYLDINTGKRKNAEILSGQGTPSVKIKFIEAGVTTSVIIGGLPEGCPQMASETVSIDPLPTAVMLEDFSGPITKFGQPRIDKILAALKNDPNARLYVFIGGKTIHSAKDREREIFVMENFSKYGRNRVIFFDIEKKIDVMQFWLVPVGADDPEFKSNGGKYDE